MPRALGVDLGTRRIGLAISDARGTVATPYATLERTNDEHDAKAIAEVASAEEAKLIVLGHPLMLDGTRGDGRVEGQHADGVGVLHQGPLEPPERVVGETGRGRVLGPDRPGLQGDGDGLVQR